MFEYTVIAMEDLPGYPHPLLYTLASDVELTEDQIMDRVTEERIEEVGKEDIYLFQILVAWEGSLHSSDTGYVFDHRG
jgi:hypothetical protein